MGINGIYLDVASFVSTRDLRIGRSSGKYYNLKPLPNQAGFFVLSVGDEPQTFKEVTQKLNFIFKENVPLLLGQKNLDGTYFERSFSFSDSDNLDRFNSQRLFNQINNAALSHRAGWCRWNLAYRTFFDELPIPLDWNRLRLPVKSERTASAILMGSLSETLGCTIYHDIPEFKPKTNLYRELHVDHYIDVSEDELLKTAHFEDQDLKQKVAEIRVANSGPSFPKYVVDVTHSKEPYQFTWFPVFAHVVQDSLGSVYKYHSDQSCLALELRLECLKMMVSRISMVIFQPFILLAKMLFCENPYAYPNSLHKFDDRITSIGLSPFVNIMGAVKCLAAAIIDPNLMIKSLA